MNIFGHINKKDYDKLVKLGEKNVLGYSNDKIKELYSKGEFKIIGEISASGSPKDKNGEKRHGHFSFDDANFDVFHVGTHNKALHKIESYICVGEHEYIAVMASRVPFLVLLCSMLAAIAVCIVLILMMLGKGPSGQFGTEHPLPDIDPNIEKIESTTGDIGEDIDPDTTTGGGDTDSAGPEETEPSDIVPEDTEPVDPVESETDKPVDTDPSETTGKDSDTEEPQVTERPAVTTKPTITPDETLPPETQAPETDDNKGGGSVSMIYTLNAQVSLKGEKIGIFFQNPQKSTHNVAVELYVISGGNEYLIGKSQLIPPGYQLSTLDYSDDNVTLVSGVYSGLYKVLFYDSTTGELANVNSHIPNVKVTVKD